MTALYRVETPSGTARSFVATGDGAGAREAAEYWFEGCTVEVTQPSLAFRTDRRAELTVEELRERAGGVR